MLRKLLVVPAALAAVVAMAAGANAQNDVGSNTTGSYSITSPNKGTISVTMGDLTLGCDSASATGVAIAGTTNTYLRYSNLGLVNCEGPGGVTANVTVDTSCTNGGVIVRKTASGTSGVDTSVAGLLDAGTSTSPCIAVSTLGGLCQLDIYDTSSAVFNETVKSTNTQDVTISGSTLTVTNVSGLCPGVSNGDKVGLNLTFNVVSSSGAINLKP